MSAALYESFDPAPEAPAGPGPDWEAGYAEGYAAGREARSAEAAALSERLVARIEDMAFAHAEARDGLISALAPLFETLVSRLLPGLSDTIAAAQIRAALCEAAEAGLDTPLELRLPEAEIAAIPALLAASGCDWLVPVPDPDLGPGEALIRGAGRPETHLDIAAMIATAQQALSALGAPDEELSRHG